MNTTRAPSELPRDIAAGDVVVSLSAQAATDEWIKIVPRGKVTTRPGGSYEFDPEALQARFAADDVKLAIDLDHGIARLASQGHTVAAIGWIEELQARPDGLYGRVEWLATGRAVLAARSHRYVSPTFHHDQDGRATWLHSVALVTAPALSKMPALADAAGHTTPETSMTKTIAAALGLSADASEASCLSAIDGLKAGKVEKAVHDTTLATLAATTAELDALKTANRKAEIDGVLEAALKAKKIMPAHRESYAALCATEDGLKQVKALLDATQAGLRDTGLDERTVEAGDEPEMDAVTLAAEAQKLVTAAAAAGSTLSIQSAVAQVVAKQKKASA